MVRIISVSSIPGLSDYVLSESSRDEIETIEMVEVKKMELEQQTKQKSKFSQNKVAQVLSRGEKLV